MRLHVTERGDPGDPVAVVIHSDGLLGAETVDLFGLAAPGFRVLAPDPTNHGPSPASVAGGTGRSQGGVPEVAMLDDDATEIAELLAEGGHLFGYSYGGVVALAIAARDPSKVRSLTLVEPPAFQLLPDDPGATATRQRIEHALAGPFADAATYWDAFLRAAFGDPPPIPPDLVPADRQEASRREQIPWEVPLDLGPLEQAGVPTLVICADWDRGFSAVSHHLAERLQGRLVVFPRANHFFLQEGPDISELVTAHWTATRR